MGYGDTFDVKGREQIQERDARWSILSHVRGMEGLGLTDRLDRHVWLLIGRRLAWHTVGEGDDFFAEVPRAAGILEGPALDSD
jgi:hypothetical protein